MSRRVKLTLAFLTPILLVPILMAQSRPRGIYAVASVENEIAALDPNKTLSQEQLDAGFDGFYQGLLEDPAIAGLALQVHWDTVNPNSPNPHGLLKVPYFWNYVDDAFSEAALWNQQHPLTAPKTIQLIVMPGFQSPPWLLSEKMIPSCNGLFHTPKSEGPPSDCGTVTFTGFAEQTDGDTYPLPWNSVYKSAWRTFLEALSVRYRSNPLLVSIAVAGPTAASAEMIVPNDGNSEKEQHPSNSAISPSDMWSDLLKFHYGDQTSYLNTDRAFINEWESAIDMYGQIFPGITLLVTTGNGFPNFTGATVTVPPALKQDCKPNKNLDCAAEATILAYFMLPGVDRANAKASQTSGMVASHQFDNMNDMGVPAVKQLSYLTEKFNSPSEQVLGGSQFSATFSEATLKEGCTETFPPKLNDPPPLCTGTALAALTACYQNGTSNGCIPLACIPQACLTVPEAGIPTKYTTYGDLVDHDASALISPEQAEYNVLEFFFDGTEAAGAFSETPGATPAPLNYLQIYSDDIEYAMANPNPVSVVTGSGTIDVNAQDLLNLASEKLFMIGEPPPSIGAVFPPANPGKWVFINGDSLASGTASVSGDFPVALAGTSVMIGGRAAGLAKVSPTQIYALVPKDSKLGSVELVVTTEFGSATTKINVSVPRD